MGRAVENARCNFEAMKNKRPTSEPERYLIIDGVPHQVCSPIGDRSDTSNGLQMLCFGLSFVHCETGNVSCDKWKAHDNHKP